VSDLLERVEESIGRRGLLRRGQSVLVAVSGGVDSMVLLRLLHKLSRKHSWRLVVAHLNHRLRGRSSEADERLVVRTARKLGLPAISEKADVKKVAREQKLSLEMAARKVRHDFLARTAMRLKIRTVALAHQADDQLELFFLRLLRGSGSEGLAGMKWRSSSPGNARIEAGMESKAIKLKSPHPGPLPAQAGRGRETRVLTVAHTYAQVELVRPLLDLPKKELLAFATKNKIPFREDASNASLDIQRNRIRHELLPLLRGEYQPALDRTIPRVMGIVGAEGEFVGEVAAEWLAGRARQSSARRSRPVELWRARSDAPYQASFKNLPVAVRRRCIQLQLLRQKVVADFDLVENLRIRPGHFIKVSPHLAVKLEAEGVLCFQESKAAAAPNPALCEVDLNKRGGQAVFDEVKFDWRVATRKARKLPNPRAGRELFDADAVGARIVLRHWRAGDRFLPSGMRSPVKLQDLFTNQKIPRDERHGLIVAETAQGEIFWVERLRIAERFKLFGGTNRCLQWQWKRRKY
jgi:tRNA(Ile)-lysidine synthase